MNKGYYIITWIILLYSCANPVAPSGGERDQDAPKVLLDMPASGSANYQGDVIEIVFDEYFTIASGEENILITPSMPEKPKFIVKGKKLIIKLPENLNPELTYSITFLDAIKDFNEGNILKSFKYVFTRNEFIDSASVSGSVVDAYSNSKMEDVFVGLYGVNDTGILNESKPIYIARTNEQGTFTIDYVKEGDYIIGAVNDKNYNYIFDQVSEEISVPSYPIKVNGSVSLEQDIQLFSNERDPAVEGYELLNNKSLYFYFSQEIEQLALDIEPYSENNIAYLNKGNDTLFYYWTEPEIKQIEFIFGLDGGNPDTINVPFSTIDVYNKFGMASELALNEKLILHCPKPLLNVNPDRLSVSDSLGNKLAFNLSFEKKSLIFDVKAVKEDKLLIQVDSGAMDYYDASWNTNSFMQYVKIISAQSKSKLSLNFENKAPAKAYLELLDKNMKKMESYDIANLTKLAINDLKPGSYFIRIYDDQNQNGKWTTGNFELKRAPEKVYLISQAIEIKLNWDKDLSLNF